jgi:hypothetical protein
MSARKTSELDSLATASGLPDAALGTVSPRKRCACMLRV